MASSLVFILLTVMFSVSVAEKNNQALCLTLNCGSPNAESDPTIKRICKGLSCNVRPIGPPFPLQNLDYPFFQDPFLFEGNIPTIPQNVGRISSVDYVLKWPKWHAILGQTDWNAWKNTVDRIKNETNIRATNWQNELEKWINLHKDVQRQFNHISNILNSNLGAYDDLLEFLAIHSIDVSLFNLMKNRLIFHPPPPQNIQTIPHPLNPLFSQLNFPPISPLIPSNFNQFGFPIPGVPNQGPPGQQGQPLQPVQPVPQRPSPTICQPASNSCGQVNVTFDVRVGNITHCSAYVNEPRQKLKNLLILASHSHKCLTFTTTRKTPTARSISGEFLYSVDGITETTQHQWIIYVRSSKKHADLNNYWPSDGDYFIIDYVDGATLQNLKK